MVNITLFAQILQQADRKIFNELVQKYQIDKHQKGINTWTHMVNMLFCHFAKANSLREIVNGLMSTSGNLNHLGIMDKTPCKSSLSYINEHRDWRFFRDYYVRLKEKFQSEGEFKRKKFKNIERKIFLIDSSLINVCINIFDWAKYRQQKGAIKLHTVIDFDGLLPEYMFITEGRQSDVRFARYLQLPRHCVIVADRGYQDFKLQYAWHKDDIVFVSRLKKTIKYRSIKERPLPDKKDQHILLDEEIELTEEDSRDNYPEKLRRVVAWDSANKKELVFVTNNFTWTANTVSDLYRNRWKIETFFKELKQHVKIKSFIGFNENAMMIQIWTALITILLLKHLKAIAKFNWCLSNLIALLRMNLFAKIDLFYWLNEPFKPKIDPDIGWITPSLFD